MAGVAGLAGAGFLAGVFLGADSFTIAGTGGAATGTTDCGSAAFSFLAGVFLAGVFLAAAGSGLG